MTVAIRRVIADLKAIGALSCHDATAPDLAIIQ